MTHMVIEMTSLQGIMGRYYARHSGESEELLRQFMNITCHVHRDSLPTNKVG